MVAQPVSPPARPQVWSRRYLLAGLLAAAAAAGGGTLFGAFSADLAAARRRVAGRSSLTLTPFGALEYAIAGEGPPLLMVHGTGGGFDQGLAMAGSIVRRGHRVIAPSRFGYLRSDFPVDPSSERQADAFAALLDHLEIDRIPVAGGSAGALSAAQFALRHPDRCTGLILLVPAANVRDRDPVEMTALGRFAVERLLRSDFLFWSALKAAPDRLIGSLLATDPELLSDSGPAERQRAHRILEELMPIGARSRGMLNDARLAGRPARMDFSRIAAPTLVISVEDDRFGTARTARDIAATMSDVRLVVYPTGGHIWIGHDDEVASEISRFVARLPA